MNRFILLLYLIIFSNLFVLGQSDTVVINYFKDSLYRVENYASTKLGTWVSDSIIFKDLKEQKEMVFKEITPKSWDDCEVLSHKLATSCIVLCLPNRVHEIINIGDSISVLVGTYFSRPLDVKHLIFINTKKWEVINRIAIVGNRTFAGHENFSFMIIGQQLLMPKTLNEIEYDDIFTFDSSGKIKRIRNSSKLFYYDRGDNVRYRSYSREKCRENDMFEGDIFIIDLFKAE